MNVSIIGAGNMGRGIARRFLSGGHSVSLASGNPENAKTVAEELGGRVQAVSVREAAARGDVVVLAAWYAVNKQLASEFADVFAKRVVVDISNPLNETFDGLVTAPTTSGGEEIRRRAPGARWVKAFNTCFAPVLAEGQLGGSKLDVLVASDDGAAKGIVFELVNSSGLRAVDAGAFAASRTLERMMLLWIEMQGRYGLQFQAGMRIMTERDPLPLA